MLRVVEGFSSSRYQQRVWVRGEGPEVDDFDDSINNFFEGCDGILVDHQNFGLTEKQFTTLRKFSQDLEAFSDDHYWTPEYINNSEWIKIMSSAQNVLFIFNYQDFCKKE